MKKTLTALMAIAVVLLIASCGNTNNSTDDDQSLESEDYISESSEDESKEETNQFANGNNYLEIADPDVTYKEESISAIDAFRLNNVKTEFDDELFSITLECEIGINDGADEFFASAQSEGKERVYYEFDVLDDDNYCLTTLYVESEQKHSLFNSVVNGEKKFSVTTTKEFKHEKYIKLRERAVSIQMHDVYLK